MYLKLRTVIEEKQFRKELRRIKKSQHRADEFMDGAKWLLARKPESGRRIAPDSDIWALPMSAEIAVQPTVLYYTFDEDTVRLLSIQTFESES